MARSDWFHPLLAAAVGLLIHFAGVGGEFLYDDLTYVQQNPSVTGEAGIFSEATPPGRPDLGLYRPVTVLTYRWNYLASGLDPYPFHLVNLLLHAAAAALLVVVAAGLGAGRPTALLAGLLFAVHPVHVEAVGWVVGRAEVLATLLALLAVRIHGRRDDPRPLLRAALGAVLYGLAALSKESALALPAFLLIADGMGRVPVARGLRLLRMLPAALICAAVISLRVLVLGRFGPDVDTDPFLGGLGPGERLPLGLAVLGRAMRSLILPFDLSIHYEPARFSGALPWLLGALAILSLGTLGWFFWRRRRTAGLLGLALLLVALLPFLHLVPIGAVFADRFLYLPSAGFCLVAAVLIGVGAGRRPALRAGVALLLLLLFAGLTLDRNPVFRDALSLWEDAAAKDPDAALPLFQLAGQYDEAGLLDYRSEQRRGALYFWRESLRVDPDHSFAPQAHVKLGEHAAGTLGDAARAAQHYRAALSLFPTYKDALLDLAALHPSPEVTREEARSLLNRVLALDPDDRQREAARAILGQLNP